MAVNPARHADRVACTATHACNGCAHAALQHKMTRSGYEAWFKLQPNARQEVPCPKHRRRQRTASAPPSASGTNGHADPAPSPGLERDAYVAWLQDALRRERSEVNRLRRYLNTAVKSLKNALERPEENTPTQAPSPYVQRAPIVSVDLATPAPGGYKGRLRQRGASDDDEPGEDFDIQSPLSGTEQLLLRTLIKASGHRASTTRLNNLVVSRRTMYSAILRCKRRGFVEQRLNIGNGEDPRSSTVALTPAGATAAHELPPEVSTP